MRSAEDGVAEAFGPAGYFYECPRWHDGRWWSSDMRGHAVYSFSGDGEAQVELALDSRPGGIGWLSDGAMVVVAMDRKHVLRRDPGASTFEVMADLTDLCEATAGFLNDLAVSPTDHVYIGFDADIAAYGMETDKGMLIHVDPQGRSEIVAGGLQMPNGIVFGPDGRHLVVAETIRPSLTAFALHDDGKLGPAEPWAPLGQRIDQRADPTPPLGDYQIFPDGCCMDAEGCIWLADVSPACLRVAPGGAIVDAVFLPDGLRSFACWLGGDDGRTLMICGAEPSVEDRMARPGSRLYLARVDVPAMRAAGR